MKELPTRINPLEYENEIYKNWLKHNYFKTDEHSNKDHYSIVIPPPNVTGSLHMGHALNVTLQDILIRFHKLCGYEVLWIPGMDHAGIATQNVVERMLAKQGVKRDDLGRDDFIKEVWKWKESSGGTILNQLKRLGASCDWSKERFTMDEGLSKAVRIVFVTLYNENLIYRSNYMVNWCPRCLTALSDLEVEYEELNGNLYYVKYPLKEGNSAITIATTRPETILGDTAVAVNPEDERYRNLIGKKLYVPLINREIALIADEMVDKDFGTGALKITPAHDPVDFDIGKKHKLEEINILDEHAHINEVGGIFKGLDRIKARTAIVEELKKESLLVRIEPYKHNVGHCYRCKTQIEPRISMQWFVKIKPLAEKAIAAVENEQIKIIPSSWSKTYFEWMHNIKDWCISRQIWWGHRIPAWYCNNCGEINVAVDTPEKCMHCNSENVTQETDVLDTWFSSALWPFTTMGWPEENDLLKNFYPTSCLVTGFDILFFWVARMIMMGLKFTDKVPFHNVYIHALVRDMEGKKMSKSKGNVIDPLEIVDKYSADALRFTLTALAAQGRDIKLSEERIEGYRNFMNKIWNSARFILMNSSEGISREIIFNELELEDKWIISRLSRVAMEFKKNINKYEFDLASNSIYNFFWHEFCDWYIEFIKYRIYENYKKNEALNSAIFVLEKSMIILHPIMPFITEYIYQSIGSGESIMKAHYPSDIQLYKSEEGQVNHIIELVTKIRNIRGEYNIKPSLLLDIYVKTNNDLLKKIIIEKREIIHQLAKVKEVHFTDAIMQKAATSIGNSFQIFIPLKDLINIEDEIKRLEKEKNALLKDITLYGNKLKNKQYLENAPQHIIDKDRRKLEELTSQFDAFTKAIEKLKTKNF